MRRTLEDLYFGNITPNEQKMAPDSELKKAVDRVTHYESQLTERLGEDEQTARFGHRLLLPASDPG